MTDSPKTRTPLPLTPAADPATRASTGRRKPGRKPLPDAQAIRMLMVPGIAPPYDDTAADRAGAPPPGNRTEPAARAAIMAPDAQPAAAWPSQFAQVLAETLAGTRPARQLTPWTTEQARKRIGQLGPMLALARQPRVRRVIVTSPTHDVLEMTVIVDLGSRARAVAVRLERPAPEGDGATPDQPDIRPYLGRRVPGDRWLCTAIEAA